MSTNIRSSLSTVLLLLIFTSPLEAADYIGSLGCGQCHQAEFTEWQGSHHQLAMAVASPDSVLGDFSDAEFTYNSVVSRFFVEDRAYKVTTDNSAGELETFDIAYTFGWEPLQQYLVKFDDGRMQTLSIAWDSRPATEGGQRWFHLYPDESVHADDVLHWTKFGMNWNTNCAECHSTNLQKNYDPVSNNFNTSWSEISVGCEACHGPASGHLDWNKKRSDDPLKGFETNLLDAKLWSRALDEDTAIPLIDSSDLPTEQEVCASCHSRRFKLGVDQDSSFYNNHQIQPIEPGLYHEDGQILDEVYVYGSFLQSKMHAAGVTCSNCHNPHSTELKAQGDAVCLQCHNPSTFSTQAHHLHPQESEGARCVSCHMPETTYMVLDPRRDHSIRIPRPDLDTPNACNQCHTSETSAWAANILESRFSSPSRNTGEALAGIWTQDRNSLNRLFRILGDSETPPFARTTAVNQLSRHNDEQAFNAAINQLRSDFPPTRLAAVEVLNAMPLQNRFQYLYPLLEDENVFVRQRASALLAQVPLDRLPTEVRQELIISFEEYESGLKANLDNPAIAVQLGNFYAQRGQHTDAIAAYMQARVIAPKYIPALLNLADLYRSISQEGNAINTLIEAERINPSQPDIKYALGLAYVRTQERVKAIDYFAEAVALEPERSNYRYAWVLSLFETGTTAEAIDKTIEGLTIAPEDQQLTYALGYFYEQTGEPEMAVDTYQKLLDLNPGHQGAAQQLRNLQLQ